ncbi:MAG: hypothetical protein EZS28_006634 [Streblomastix strix]|uniref:Uncharacterized protein n=1 Tax=Streblomastix strix TaxID=222440 RepID=A0A5J4WRU1_9EUKA|nr:MAG: hypothetical protein EZS28_006634 [Streblomastix strix]
MTYAQIANSQEEQMRFFMDHGPRACLIANNKFGRPTALLPLPSAPPVSTASSIGDSDSAIVAHGPVDIARSIQRGASAEDTENQLKFIRDDAFWKEMARIVGVYRPSQFVSNKVEPRDSWSRSAELNRQRQVNLLSTSEPVEMQSIESSQVYIDCSRAVSLAGSALLDQILHTKPDQPASRIDQELSISKQQTCRSTILTSPRQLPELRQEGEEEVQNGAQSRMDKKDEPENNDDLIELQLTINTQIQFGKNQCYLNLCPVQCGGQIIELLAAMQIHRPARQNIERYSAYLERPRHCSRHRSPETQDRIHGRLRGTFGFMQDYLVRAGRRRYNPGPGLFRYVVEFNIRNHKEDLRLEKDPGLLNSEQQFENRVSQAEWNNEPSRNNNVQRLGYCN